MIKKIKIQSPKISSNLYKYSSEEIIESVCNYETIEDALIEDEDIQDINDINVRLNGCIFKNVVFENCDFRKIDMVDIIFENCDLSNINFSDSGIYRVEFINCKLTGSVFNDCTIKSVSFKESMARYSNFAFSKFKGVNLVNSDFAYSVFQEVDNCSITINNTNLTKAIFTGMNLENIDFTTNNIEGIELNLKDVKGGIFSMEQAIDLTKLMGIFIK